MPSAVYAGVNFKKDGTFLFFQGLKKIRIVLMKKNDFESEKKLAEKASKGDVGAFEKLFSAHKGRIYNYSLKMTGDIEASKEITQDVFVRVFKNLTKLRQKEMFNIWIMKIAVNLVKDFLRGKSRDSSVFDRNIQDEMQDKQTETQAYGKTPEEIIISEERNKAILQSLSRIKPSFREILVLYYVEGLSLKEISSVSGIPEGTVKSRLSRGRGAMMEKLKSMGY